jgi:4-amino-4-deoxy-L-arabinose transferase-like glycosyltransferase
MLMFFRNGLKRLERKTAYRLILIAILILAAFIYLYNLGRESLTTDEYFSFYLARQPLAKVIFGHQSSSNPNTIPPLYEIILHLWLKIFGISEFAQRSLSACLGILSVYLIYRLAGLLFNIPTGLISALFASLSLSWFTFFRQNRCYSLLICLSLLSFYLFFYLLKNKKSRLALPFLIITNIALAYNNYFGFLVILCQVIFALLEAKGNMAGFKKILFMCLCVALAYGPWYANLLYDIKKEPLLSIKIPDPQLHMRLFAIFITFFADFHIRWEPLLLLFYLAFIVRGWKRLRREKDENLRYLSLFLFMVYPVTFAVVYWVTLSYRVRYYSTFSFPLFILLSLGMQKITLRPFKKMLLLLVCLFIFVLNFADFRDFFAYSLNEDWRGAAQYIKRIPGYKNKNMVFLFQTKYNSPVFAYYYWDKRIADAFMNNITDYQNYENDLLAMNSQQLNSQHRVYLISEQINDKRLFEKIGAFADDTWIWLFRYHEPSASFYLQINNKDNYFLHQIPLNPELPQINLFLFKRIKK